jgi:L-malate glycosyltransferase
MPNLTTTDATRGTSGYTGRRQQQPGARLGASLALCAVGELFGGVERHVLDVCRFAQQRTGTHPFLVVFHDGELASRARVDGVPTVVVRGRHRYDLRLCDELARLVSSSGIRVLHAHGYKATILCALAKRRMNHGVVGDHEHSVRLIRTEHGLIEPVGSAVGWAKMHVNGTLDLLATRHSADAVCYVTADLERHYRHLHKGLLRKVIHNGIQPLDRNSFVRPKELEPGLFHLGIVGRVTGVKGIDSAIRAIQRPGLPGIVRLNIIGSGPSEESLRSLSVTLGLQDRVRFLGFKPNVHDYMAYLDALLMPSLHEGLPYTLLEAMSLGLPIIASDVGGLREVLRNGQTGIMVPAGDVSRLALAIEQVVTRAEAARALGLAAAAEQRRGYTLDAMGQAYWRVYEAVLRAKELTHSDQ